MTTKTKSSAPKQLSQTPFKEKNGDCRSYLGNPRWERVPAFPTRARVQEIVTGDEREEAARILKAFRENEAVVIENDIVAKTEQARQLEASHNGHDVVKARTVREEVSRCDHEKYLAATSTIRDLISEAAEIVKPILDRAIESHDWELNDLALAREADLTRLGIPLFTEVMPGGNKTLIDGRFIGQMDRSWELWK